LDRMLTYRQHMEATEPKCKKGLSVLKVMAAKGIEESHLFLLCPSAALSVTDHGLGIKARNLFFNVQSTMASFMPGSQTNLLQLHSVQNEAMRFIPVGNYQGRRVRPCRSC